MSQLNRRNALATLATLPALSVPAVAAAATPHPDAELLALGKQLEATQDTLATVNLDTDARESAYMARRVPMPDVCRPQPGGERALGASFREGIRHDGFFSPSQIKELRSLKEQHVAALAREHERSFPDICGRGRFIERASEVIRAYDEWKPNDDALQRETGADRIDDDTGAAVSAVIDIEIKIMETLAHTLDGVAVKARAAFAFWGEDSRDNRVLSEQPVEVRIDKNGGYRISSDLVLWHLVRDILVMHQRLAIQRRV
jgi:hypothetical protein